MSLARASTTAGGPHWLPNFRAWLAGLSPSVLADVIDELALELTGRHIEEHEALRTAAEKVRAHHVTRVQQAIDGFSIGRPRGTSAPSSARGPMRR